jgi:vanillate O-demethylase ferredoxin subunit
MNIPAMRNPKIRDTADPIGSVDFQWTRNAAGQGQAMNSATETRAVTVAAQWIAGRDIHVLELAAADGRALPDAEAGAHIDLHLPNGLVRQYSLMEPGPAPDRYRIGVLRDADSRGGSACVAEEIREGDRLSITGPRNHFALDETADDYVLVAGGIGITPLVAMARRLADLGRPVELHYLVRERERAAFVDELGAVLPEGALHLHVDEEGGSPDLAAIAGEAGDGRQLYACGPGGLLDAIRDITADWPAGHVHFEQFSNDADGEAAAEAACEIELRRSGVRFTLEAGETLLEALHRHDIDVPCACTEGVCGTCAVDIVEGAVEHRDALQDDDEKADNAVMFVCVSRPLGAHLVLDL